MTRSLGNTLPEALRHVLDGSDLANRQGLTFLLNTTDDVGRPHMALLSVGELVSTEPHTVRAAVWLHSGTSKNLSNRERAMLTIIANGNAYYVQLRASRGPDLDLGAAGRLAYFVLDVEDVLEDSAEYATLTSGVTFQLKQPDQVVPRWQRSVDALRSAPGVRMHEHA